jgi:hypothetical protein
MFNNQSHHPIEESPIVAKEGVLVLPAESHLYGLQTVITPFSLVGSYSVQYAVLSALFRPKSIIYPVLL